MNSNDNQGLLADLGLTGTERRIQGSLYGSGNPNREMILRMLELYKSNHLKLDELITDTYNLDEINKVTRTWLPGNSSGGVILHGTWVAGSWAFGRSTECWTNLPMPIHRDQMLVADPGSRRQPMSGKDVSARAPRRL